MKEFRNIFDCYPFGSAIPGRKFQANSKHRHGFQEQEEYEETGFKNEVSSLGKVQDIYIINNVNHSETQENAQMWQNKVG